MQNKEVKFIDWGLLDYQDAWDKQEEIFAKTLAIKHDNRVNNTQDPTLNFLIFTEHPHVYTGHKCEHILYLLQDEERLQANETPFYEIKRGVDVTCPGSGQIMAYPILELDHFVADSQLYVRTVEEAIVVP